MVHVPAGTDVAMRPDNLKIVFFGDGFGFVQIFVPDAVLAVGSAGIGFFGVPCPLTGVDANRHTARPDTQPLPGFAIFFQHAQRTTGAENIILQTKLRLVGIKKNIARQTDILGRVPGPEGSLNFRNAHRVDLDSGFQHLLKNFRVGAGLHGKAHHRRQWPNFCDGFAEDAQTIDIDRGAELLGDFPDIHFFDVHLCS